MRAALAYPFGGEPRFDAVLVGGGLHLLAVWIPLVPFLAVAGYLVRVLEETATAPRLRDAARPNWRPVGPLLRDGAVAAGICLAYLAIPIGLLVVTLGGPLERVDPTGGADGLVFLVGSTVVLLVALAAAYPLPAALAAYARRRRIRAAFDRRLLAIATRDGGYLFAVVVAATGLALTAAAYAPLNRLALGFFFAFVVEVAVAAAVGSAVGSAWERAGQ